MDGAIGGLTPRGSVHMAIYSEKSAIPREQEFHVSDQGQLGKLQETVSREGIIRELEVDVIMDLESARNLKTWLDENIKTLEKVGKKRIE